MTWNKHKVSGGDGSSKNTTNANVSSHVKPVSVFVIVSDGTGFKWSIQVTTQVNITGNASARELSASVT